MKKKEDLTPEEKQFLALVAKDKDITFEAALKLYNDPNDGIHVHFGTLKYIMEKRKMTMPEAKKIITKSVDELIQKLTKK